MLKVIVPVMLIATPVAYASDMQDMLNSVTTLATKTRMNTDWSPENVTVLRGSDMEAMGVRTVEDAMSHITSVNVIDGNITVRGVNPWGSGKIKIMINGVTTNNSISGDNRMILRMPISMVDRIEVIRGPGGGSLYGEYAMMAVINVITRDRNSHPDSCVENACNRAWASTGSHAYRAVGLTYANDTESPVNVDVNISGYGWNGVDPYISQDGLFGMGQADISYAPGVAPNGGVGDFAMVGIKRGDTTLSTMYLSVRESSGYGTTDVLPPDDRYIHYDMQWINTIRSDVQSLGDSGAVELSHVMNQTRIRDNAFFPPGFFSAAPTESDIGPDFPMSFMHFHPDGINGDYWATEHRFSGSVMGSHKINDHLLHAEVGAVSINVSDAGTSGDADPLTLTRVPYQTFTDERSWLASGIKRQIYNVVLQDQWSVDLDTVVTMGVRFDRYSDVGSVFSPRLAVVHTLNSDNIIKAQWSQAFRPPTFVEMYTNTFVVQGNPEIRPETTDIMTLSHVYRSSTLTTRIGVYHQQIQNYIDTDFTARKYVNVGRVSMDGVELEADYQIFDGLNLGVKLGINSVEYTGVNIGDTPGWLLNTSTRYNMSYDSVIMLSSHHFGGFATQVQEYDPQTQIDASWTYAITPSVTLRSSVKNVLNTSLVAPGPIGSLHDYPQDGRSALVNLTVVF